jgi:phage terminase large subunit
VTTQQIKIPSKLIPIFDGSADIRGAYGGRGSAKTRSFATMIAVRGFMFGRAGTKGLLLCGRQFMNSLADSSLEECKRAIEDQPFLKDYYEIGQNYIKSKDGNIEFAFIGLDRNIASVKSKGRILICWVDEAEPVTDEAWNTLIPTLREEGENWNAELWVTWNPKRRKAAVEKRFRFANDQLIKVVELNHADNPKFPAKLERERLRDKEERPDQYEHIWEGDYIGVVEGAYYAKCITQAKAENRIGRVGADPLMTYKAFCDIGGTGAKADAFTIWIAQFIGRELRVLNYYEAVGQPAAAHVSWLRDNGYIGTNTTIWLPHDGDTQDKVYDVSYRKAFEQVGYSVEVVPNQGKGAAMARVKAGQRVFPSMWIDSEHCDGGLEAVGWYHEKRDENREIGLGPEHDWSSHGCLVAGSMISVIGGLKTIESIEIGDYVVTPNGFGLVVNAGQTKISTDLIEVTTESGKTLTVTPEHKMFMIDGVRTADTLMYNDYIVTNRDTSCLSLANAKSLGYRDAFIENTMVSNIGIGVREAFTSLKKMVSKQCFIACGFLMYQAKMFASLMRFSQYRETLSNLSLVGGVLEKKIQEGSKNKSMIYSFSLGLSTTKNQMVITNQTLFTTEVNQCIASSGLTSMEKLKTDSIFTTSMELSPTTESKTLSAFQQANTRNITEKLINGLVARQIKFRLGKLENCLRVGMQALKGWIGTLKMALKHGLIELNTKAFVQVVAKSTKHSSLTALNSAEKVVSLRRFTKEVPVYDLTIEHDHCYFANGMLVSNSDSFGMMAIVFESIGAPNQMKPIKYKQKLILA